MIIKIMRKIIVIFLVLIFSQNAYSACDTKEKLEEKEKNKALSITGFSGTTLNEKTGKYEKYNPETCAYEEVG